MDLKSSLGKKIRTLRQNLNLSRENFCADESELTVRQLARIESGDSLPTLVKLQFIAERLGISVVQLIDTQSVALPEGYRELKYKIMMYRTYGDAERLAKMDDYFDEMYARYYDQLPEEEQLAVEIQQAIADVISSQEAKFAEPLVQDYFHQVQQKKQYNENDLLLIKLYFYLVNADINLFDDHVVNNLLVNILKHIDVQDEMMIIILSDCFLIILTIFDELGMYVQEETIFPVLYNLILQTRNFKLKAVVQMLEAKSLMHGQGLLEEATLKYQQAINGAKFIEDDVLLRKLEQEYQRDKEKYLQNNEPK